MTKAPAEQNNTTKQAKGVLFLTIFIAMLGLSVLFPVVGPLSRELGLSETQVGWFATIYSLMQLLCSPFWGKRSETVGRKPVLLMGLVGFSLSFLLFAVVALLGLKGVLGGTAVFVGLLFARFVGGVLSSATLPTAQAMMADLSSEGDRTAAMGLIGAAFGLGVVFGPALGAGLSHFGMVAPVFFSAALGLVTAVVGRSLLPETRRASKNAAPPSSPRELLRSPAVRALCVISALYTLASVSMEQTLAFFVGDQLGLSGEANVRAVGGMLLAFGLVSVAVQGGFMRTIGKKYPPRQLVLFGSLIMGVGMLLVPQWSSFWPMTLSLAVVGLGTAVLGPSLTAALSLQVGPDQQGSVAGLNSSALALGRMTGPLFGTALFQYFSPAAPYLAAGGILLALWLYMLVFSPTKGREEG